ncbi:ATP-grasp domain-containing protein [Zooshikella harenae]|uniref:ATP-grasp domain-containing protein n=1 Tax=Zooshikella harenae TaxID=2827238 RepID=A0ABS5ZJG4_9GAMM|nr:ATP-grasp domain-containing protein [Zooshikella harenae]MBU2714234.1 ATP-grasp domain-containing protein [Zooshikella harenae]
MKRILITNADGNLGAGIAKLLTENFSADQLQTVALVNKSLSLAEHLCDEIINYPEECSIDGEYNVKAIADLCCQHKIDGIIPLTDHETVVFSAQKEALPFLFCSEHALSLACYDKWHFQQLLAQMDVEVPDTWLPSQCPTLNSPYLVKPRMGGLSMGIAWDSPDIKQFSDDYVVQRYLKGSEVTIAIYKSLDGSYWGPFVGERNLFHGMTSYFKPILPNKGINQFVAQFAKLNTWQGPCNIQGMMQDEKFVPFEVNLRFSGSSSLRNLLGFKDVVWAIQEWLGEKPRVDWAIKDHFAIRYFADHLIA